MTNNPTTKTCSRCGKTFTGTIYLCAECEAELEKREGEYGVKINEPTTGEIVRALRNCEGGCCSRCGYDVKNSCANLQSTSADRLESQERELVRNADELLQKTQALEDAKQRHAKKDAEDAELYEKAIARAESAERERDAIVKSVDALAEAWEKPNAFEVVTFFKKWRGLPQEGNWK